jgi:hypothetical protein
VTNVSSRKSAIYCYNNQGPSMGSLYCSDSNNWTIDNIYLRYVNIGIPSKFTVEHYEVFQVIRQ